MAPVFRSPKLGRAGYSLALCWAMSFFATAAQAQISYVPPPPETLVAPHDVPYYRQRLQSNEEAVWREGQVGLIFLGPAAIPGLEPLAERDDPPLRKRIRELLVVGMLKTFPWSEIKKQPNLALLVGDEVDRGLGLAKQVVEVIESKQARDVEFHLHRPGKEGEPSLFDKLRKLSGCAVPAAQWLCAHESPIARGQGLVLLEFLDATIGRPDVERLKNDPAEVPFLTGPNMVQGAGRTTLAKRAAKFEHQVKQVWSLSHNIANYVEHFLAREGIEDPYHQLTLNVQSYAWRDKPQNLSSEEYLRELHALSWDAWWTAARRVWPIWRETFGGPNTPEDQQRFHQWMNRRINGLTFEQTPTPSGPSLFRVVEPAGGHCRIYHGDKLVDEGPIPFATRLTYVKPSIVKVITPAGDAWETKFPTTTLGQTYTLRFYQERLN